MAGRRRSILLGVLTFAAGAAIAVSIGYLMRPPSPRTAATVPAAYKAKYGQAVSIDGFPRARVFKLNAPIPFDTSSDEAVYKPSPAVIANASLDDREVIISANGKAVRRGDRLWLGFDDGTSMLFTDDGLCNLDGICDLYRLVAYQKDSGLFIVGEFGLEWFSALVMSQKNGEITRVKDKPVFSIDRRFALVSILDLLNDSYEFSIYSTVDGQFKREAACDGADQGALAFLKRVEWVGSEIAIIHLDPRSSALSEDEMPVVQRIDGKWRVIGPVTPTMNGKKDVPLDYECQPPK